MLRNILKRTYMLRSFRTAKVHASCKRFSVGFLFYSPMSHAASMSCKWFSHFLVLQRKRADEKKAGDGQQSGRWADKAKKGSSTRDELAEALRNNILSQVSYHA